MTFATKVSAAFVLFKSILLTVVLCIFAVSTFAQDVWLQNHSSPNSGCGLSGTETVNVLVNNNSGSIMGSNTINVSYTIDGGSLTSQLLNSNLFPGASWNFTFTVKANLAACGPHTVKVWVARAGDTNPLNDTLTWLVQNDCPIVPGTISGAGTVCAIGNGGTLSLSGWSNGTIIDWQTSVNGGVSWSPTGNNTASYNFASLSQNTSYQVVIDGGLCVDDTAGIATILLQPVILPGTIAGSDSVCITNANGTLVLSGNSGAVLQWESSTDNGASWSTIANTTTTHNYSGLTTTTWYRALVEGTACPDVYTDTAIIFVEDLTDSGVLIGSDSLCIDSANGTITIGGNIGSVSFWESSSNNGSTWTTINNQTSSLTYTSLTSTTLYRAYTDGGFCPSYYSDTAEIFIQPLPSRPTIVGSDSVCITNANGTLTLLGATTSILDWEYSIDNGVNWYSIGNNTATLNYSMLSTTTHYRTFLDGGFCSDYYSDTAVVFIEPLTDQGMITGGDSLCISNASGVLTVTGNIGSVSFWESSTNSGASWSPISNTTTTLTFTNLPVTTWYRAYTDGGFCPSYWSDTAVVYVEPLVIPGNLSGSDSVCIVTGIDSLIYSGGTGVIDHWETSTDGGVTWSNVSNTTATFQYNGVTTTTWYRVFLKGIFCAGEYSDTAIIFVESASNAGVLQADGSVCLGSDYSLTLTGNVGTNYAWESSIDGFTWLPTNTGNNTAYDVSALTSDSLFRVIVQNGICPSDTSNSVNVTLYPLAVADAGLDTTIFLGDTLQLAGSGGVLGVWTPGLTLSDSTVSNPLAIPTMTTMYTYHVIDLNGCMAQDSVLVTVVLKIPDDVIIRNVITANGDGYNDTWNITNVENYPSTFVIVFNIYGEEVYKSDDYQNDWKGTYKNEQLPNGTYYYTVILGGQEDKLKGTLTILGDE